MPEALQTNTTISHYRILRKLGAGGMGEVYLGQDTRLDRKVALKILPAEFTRDQDRVRRFIQEAKAASALNHPNIVTIHEIGEVDDAYYLVTEYIEGQTLRVRMTTRMELGQVLEVGVQIAGALAAAHTAGIVHRDIKNLMLEAGMEFPSVHPADLESQNRSEGWGKRVDSVTEDAAHDASTNQMLSADANANNLELLSSLRQICDVNTRNQIRMTVTRWWVSLAESVR